jgi:hypothetical protein
MRTTNLFDLELETALLDAEAVSSDELDDAIAEKQDALVSGTNIKTINGNSLLGTGNLVISGGSGTGLITYLSDYADLEAAVSAIGATEMTLVIDTDDSLTTAVTIPSTLKLAQANNAQIDIGSAGSIKFEGYGLMDALTPRGLFKTSPTLKVGIRNFLVDVSTNQINSGGHGLSTGMLVKYETVVGSTIGGLTDGDYYFVIVIDTTHYKLATTHADALAGTGIDLTSTGGDTGQITPFKLVWDGDSPVEISTEVIDTDNNSLTDRVKCLVYAFYQKKVRFIASPRNIDTGVIFGDYQSIHFLTGEYTNNFNPNATANAYIVPFNMGSYSSFTADGWDAVIYESNYDALFDEVDPTGLTRSQTAVVHTQDGKTGIKIEGVHFKYNPNSVFNSSTTTAAIVNSTYCSIRHCWFDGCRAYHAGVIQSGYTGTTNDYEVHDNYVEHNLCTGFVTQNLYIIGGYRNHLRYNRILLRGAVTNAYSSIIDLEPNVQFQIIHDCDIVGNYIDARDVINENGSTVTVADTGFNDTTNVITTTGSHPFDTGHAVLLTGTLPSGLTEGTLYWVIDTSSTTFKLAASSADALASTAIDFGTGASGSIVIERQEPLNTLGILAQSIYTDGMYNIRITDNVILSYDEASVYPNYMAAGLDFRGGYNIEVARNVMLGNGAYMSGIRELDYHDNKCTGTSIFTSVKGKVYNNWSHEDWRFAYSSSFAGRFTEAEEFKLTFESDGSTVDLINTTAGEWAGNAYQFYKGMYAAWNEQLYKIASATDNQFDYVYRHLTFDPPIPAITIRTVPLADFNSATNEITYTAHGFETGAIVGFYRTVGSVVPTNLPDYAYYYVIKVSANVFKLALTRADALANTAIDFDASAGSGSFDFHPTMQLRFTEIEYLDNHMNNGSITGVGQTGYELNPLGKSQILSTYTDGRITEVADAAYTCPQNAGVILYTSLTASRTVTLPSYVGLYGKEIVVKDGAGTAGTHSIVIDGAGSETIEGSSSISITTNYGIKRVKAAAGGWIIL